METMRLLMMKLVESIGLIQIMNLAKRWSGWKRRLNVPQSFLFYLQPYEWIAVAPREAMGQRKLSGEWTNLFSDKMRKTNPASVLSFVYNREKTQKSRKHKACFVTGKAVCTFTGCSTFIFKIEKDPNPGKVWWLWFPWPVKLSILRESSMQDSTVRNVVKKLPRRHWSSVPQNCIILA